MARVVVAKLNPSKGKAGSKAKVVTRRVRGPDGVFKTLRVLDLGSDTFGEDLKAVFTRNVEKARNENAHVTGARDVAIPKG